MSRIVSVGTALPESCHEQETITGFLEQAWAGRGRRIGRLRELHSNLRVATRHLALPLDAYFDLDSFGKANDVWIECALQLGQVAIETALQSAGLAPSDVDALFTVSVTGIASPALDARLMNRMPLRSDLKRIPIFGLGCVGGVAGVARAAEHVRAFPDGIAILLAVELCSLTFQSDDLSVAHMISAGLFGDGAAAVVVAGADRHERSAERGPRVVATRSIFYPDTEDVMGWRISERGFGIVLSPGVPAFARERIGPDVASFLADQELRPDDIGAWICHPGGPKVLRAMQESLGLADAAVRRSWDVLARQGNLSSASVLMVLHDVLEHERPAPGTRGLMIAMGPAFCSEIVLLEW